MNAWLHFKTITRHKFLVMGLCFRLGLYKQGLLHDLSKYSITEFKTGIRYYQGDKSPNTEERNQTGVSDAWLHHKGRNKHHLEYWIDYSVNPEEGFTGMKMPLKYVVEMFCDRIAACKNYQKEAYTDASPLVYYERGVHRYRSLFHKESRALLEHLLQKLAQDGEEQTLQYVKKEILTKKADIAKKYE